MTRGRKPRAAEVADAIDSSLDQPKIEGAVAAMRDHAQENLLELLDLAGDIKAIQMADLTANFLRASQVRLFQRVRESKKINNLPIRMQDGRVATCDSIREACPLLFGRSYDTMLREEESFALLGEQAYDVATRLGLNRSALRAARALPPEKLEMVRIAIASGSTKSEVLSVIEDLAIKVEEATQEAAEAKADLEAKDHLLAEKNKRIDQLKAAQKRIDKLPPDEALAELQKEATGLLSEVLVGLRGGLRQALIALRNHGDEDHSQFMAGLVGQVQADLIDLRDEFGLPDTVGDGTPEWKRWVAAQDADKSKASH